MTQRPTSIKRKRSAATQIIRTTLFVFVCLVIIVQCVTFLRGPHTYLGQRTISILRGADRIESYRFKEVEPRDEPGLETIKDYPIKSRGGTKGKVFASRVANVLLNPITYMGLNDVSCLIQPGVGFRLWRARESVDVIICFHCQQMLITARDATGKKIHCAYTEIHFVRSALVKLAREAFPQDLAIRKL